MDTTLRAEPVASQMPGFFTLPRHVLLACWEISHHFWAGFLGLRQSKPSRVLLQLTLMPAADTLGWGVFPVLPASPVHLSAIASLELTVAQGQRPGKILFPWEADSMSAFP